MASSRNDTAITWSAATSVTLSTNNVTASDAFAFNVEDWEAMVHISADNAGTPASGDYVDFWVAWNMGDVLGDTGDDFNTDEHAQRLGRIDTVAANSPGEDPGRASFLVPTAAKGFKLLSKANQGATRNIVVRALVTTHRPQ